jgi:hypothetical protein
MFRKESEDERRKKNILEGYIMLINKLIYPTGKKIVIKYWYDKYIDEEVCDIYLFKDNQIYRKMLTSMLTDAIVFFENLWTIISS